MKTLLRVVLYICPIFIMVGCKSEPRLDARLIGTWQTGIVESKLGGPNRITLEYGSDGRMNGQYYYSGNGKTFDWTGSWSVEGNLIVRVKDGKTQTFQYAFRDTDTMERNLYGQLYVFERKHIEQ